MKRMKRLIVRQIYSSFLLIVDLLNALRLWVTFKLNANCQSDKTLIYVLIVDIFRVLLNSIDKLKVLIPAK